ncbi:MAG: hypothetical protein ARM1_0181 [Candidatus Micrarchaeota archaeon]|nr:MAG: hypothetical protein ARM1_0181 [Candidatus Micrarchaeota archaeon]
MENSEGESGSRESHERRGFGGSMPFEKPVKEGDTIKVTVVGKGNKGDAIAKVKGFVIFVKDPENKIKEGDEVSIKVTSVRRSFATAEITS